MSSVAFVVYVVVRNTSKCWCLHWLRNGTVWKTLTKISFHCLRFVLSTYNICYLLLVLVGYVVKMLILDDESVA